MNIETLKQAIEIAKMLDDETPATKADGRKVIVRSRDAGVLYGTLESVNGSTVEIADARQLWKWFAANGHTLIDVATYGVDASKCKFSPASASVTLVNVCAIIDTTEAAQKLIEAA
jgi:hypothetical protein